jgi:hypothetical protein
VQYFHIGKSREELVGERRVKRTGDEEIEPPAKRMKGKCLAAVGLKLMDKTESSESLGPRRNPTRSRKATPVQKVGSSYDAQEKV